MAAAEWGKLREGSTIGFVLCRPTKSLLEAQVFKARVHEQLVGLGYTLDVNSECQRGPKKSAETLMYADKKERKVS